MYLVPLVSAAVLSPSWQWLLRRPHSLGLWEEDIPKGVGKETFELPNEMTNCDRTRPDAIT